MWHERADKKGLVLSGRRPVPERTAIFIYQALLSDILGMRLRPNERLIEKELLERFGVSRTPLREALLRLVDDGLVVIYPQVGSFIARIPIRPLIESIRIRQALEIMLVETATMKASAADLAALQANLDHLDQACRENDHPAFHELDNAFHGLIGRMADMKTVTLTISHIRLQIDRYRMLTLPQQGRLPRVIQEHREIIAAMNAHDVQAASAAMHRHLGQMAAEVATLQSLDPNDFDDDREKQDDT